MPVKGLMERRKIEMWPRPHNATGSFSFELDNGSIDTTIVPIIHYDEGQGAPDSYNSHPQNASHTISGASNCFVNSRINRVFAEFRVSATSLFYDHKIQAIRVAFMPIHMAFKEDYDATDELSGATIKSVLVMEYETTDRQGRPIFNSNDMAEKYTDSGLLWDTVGLGLTTDETVEGTAFDQELFYDTLQYSTIGKKLTTVCGGLKWFTITQRFPTMTYRIRITPDVKRMNEYAFLGCMVHCPVQGSSYQMPVLTRDLTAATQYIDVDWAFRYYERNDDFDHAKV